jgi:multidrug efflux pump subunit AcrA (membrane-fusion protein)
VTVLVGALTAENTTAGAVVPVLESQVAAQVAGVVARILRNPGDWVKAGEAVVQLDDSQLALAVHNAEASLENARISYEVGQDTVSQSNPKLQLQVQAAQSTLAGAQKNYEAQKALVDVGGTSASALDNAASQLQQAQANLQAAQTALEQNQNSGTQSLAQLKLAVDQAANQLEAARINLRNATVRAPFDGQIAAVNVTPGGFVSQNTSVFLLVSAERQVSFSVPPPDAASLPAGAVVHFTYGGRQSVLHVSQAPSAPIDGVVPMVAAVRPASALPYGAVGAVSYTVSVADGALVPIAALGTFENRTFVYSIIEGKAVIQQITILGETGVTAAVAGIQAGTRVIVNPPPGLLAGAAVQVVSAPGAAAQQGAGAATQPSGPGAQSHDGAAAGQAGGGRQ